jgi:hypothetical protein
VSHWTAFSFAFVQLTSRSNLWHWLVRMKETARREFSRRAGNPMLYLVFSYNRHATAETSFAMFPHLPRFCL